MKLRTIKTLWGCFQLDKPDTWAPLFRRIKDEGFDGIEMATHVLGKDLDRFVGEVKTAGLLLVAQLHTTTYTPGNNGVVGSSKVEDHIASFREQLLLAKHAGAVHVNSHSGYDVWTAAQTATFVKAALDIEKEVGLPVSHETHRRRLLYSPAQALELLPAHPDMKVTADLSHWTCVSERIFNEHVSDEWWPGLLATVAQRTRLIHARVGHSQGPQVSHPAAPEFEYELKAFERWWTAIMAQQHAQGAEVIYVEPEFGPAPYLQHLPYTNVPVAELWDINSWIHQRVRALWAAHPEWSQ